MKLFTLFFFFSAFALGVQAQVKSPEAGSEQWAMTQLDSVVQQATQAESFFDTARTQTAHLPRQQASTDLRVPHKFYLHPERLSAYRTAHDSAWLNQQRNVAYALLSDFTGFMTGEKIDYQAPEIQEIMDEELDFFTADKLFDPSSADAPLLEEIEYTDAVLPDLSRPLVEARLAALENEIPLNLTPVVHHYLDFYLTKKRYFLTKVIQRSQQYFPIFEEILAEHDMPDELKYLAVIESGLLPDIRSHAGAVGLWQFMPRTGRIFGLKYNYYVDQRMNPVKSTIAACKYLKYLYDYFDGDWELAMAAYNCGPGNINKAKRRSGGETFWEIYDYLPRETRGYVPQFVAAMYLMTYREEHHLPQLTPELIVEQDTLLVSQHLDLKLLAKELKVCEEDLKALNPDLRRGVVPHYSKNHPVVIPKNRKNYVCQNREVILAAAQSKTSASARYRYTSSSSSRSRSIPKNISTGNFKAGQKVIYQVKGGDTVSEIAAAYGVSTRSVMNWNGMATSRINVGQRLVIYPKTSKSTLLASAKKTAPKAQPKDGKYYTVQPGDTLWGIAKKLPGVTVTKIRQLNNLSSDRLSIGQRLKVG